MVPTMDNNKNGLVIFSSMKNHSIYTTETYSNNTALNDTELAPSSNAIPGVTIAYIVIGLFGLLGNIFVLVVILKSKKMQKTVINKLILYQSFLDGMAAFWILITCNIRYGGDDPDESLREQIKCIMWNSKMFMWALFLASTFNLVIITLERYLVLFDVLFKSQFTSKAKWNSTELAKVAQPTIDIRQVTLARRKRFSY